MSDTLPRAVPVAPDPAGTAPLTWTQERIWFEERLNPGSTTYHMPVVSRVRGDLDLPALRSAVDLLVRRHSALRTVFRSSDGNPVQRVISAAEAQVVVEERDVRDRTDPEAAARAEALREGRRLFDLAHGPLIRVLVIRSAAAEWLLVVTVHHIVFDGWSFGILFGELSSAYAAARNGATAELPLLRKNFADAARTEREQLDGEAVEGLLSWWREYLADTPQLLDLPVDHARPAVRGHRGAQARLRLDPTVSAGTRALGRSREATLYTTLLAAFGVVLARQTGQDTMLVGSPVSTRGAGQYRLLGCFLNTLPVRLDLAGDPAFGDLLDRVRHSSQEAFAHQRVPFHRLVDDQGPGGDLARSRLVQVFFNVVPPVSAPDLAGCTVESLPFEDVDNKFDLTLYVSDAEGLLTLDAVYDAELYLPARIEDLLDQTAAVLAQAVARPDVRISDLDLGTSRSRARSADPSLDQPARHPEPLTSRLAEHARRTPDRPALIGAGRTLNYADLWDGTERISRWLHGRGVGRGDVVAVHASRHPATAVALLGVLRSGAAFAVLDADRPAEETALRATELAPRAWLAAAPGRQPGAFADGPVLDVGAVLAGALPDDAVPESGTGTTPGPDDPAYVAFTSGTTGRPRRIIGTHGPLIHFLDWYAREFRFTPADRFSVLSGLGHDPFLRDVLAPLWAGAAAVFPDADVRDAETLAAELRSREVTVTHLTPALADSLAAVGGPGWPQLRLAGFGGDVLTWRTVQEWTALAPGADLLNLYGATETPQAVSVHLARAAGGPVPSGRGRVPLGAGIDAVQLLVLNGERQTGIGELGEVVVRTPHLARYAEERPGTDRPEGPERRTGFTGSPFADRGSEWVYRTGDRARLRPDGLLDYVGRADQQVKVRGFRVEPAEIETALLTLPSVRAAAVLAVPEPGAGHRLVGYLATGGERPDLAAVRRSLAARLADHKVPGSFVVVDTFPLTANGKLDRAGLASLGPEESAVAAHVPPAAGIETELAAIWAEVLRRERIGATDDFFALGGHSLLLSQVLVRVRRELGTDLTLRDLFEHPTVAGLAQLVGTTAGTAEEAGAAHALPVPRSTAPGPAPLSWTQESLWFEEQLRPGDAAYNMPLVLRISGPLDTGVLQRAVDSVVARNAVLRSRFSLVDGAPVQTTVPRARVVVREADLGAVSEASALESAMRETKRPFDLAEGPLLRVAVLRSGGGTALLVLTVHHIVFDGWSFGLLLDALGEAYRADAGDTPQPSERPDGLQFADVARWERGELAGRRLEELLSWWSEYLGDTPTLLQLPTDRPRPPVQAHRGARYRFAIDAATSEGLRTLGRETGATLFMTLLSAFGVVLSRHTGQRQLLVGTPVANRSRPEFEELVGCFVNTVPVRVDLRDEPVFTELLGRVRDSALAAFEHQQVPFSKLVGAHVAERDLSRNPLVQVLFALQNVRLGSFDAPGLSSELVEATAANSQFDLNLRMLDDGREILGWLDYDTDLFDEATVQRLVEHLSNVTAAVVAQRQVPVSTVELIGSAERERLLTTWNDTAESWSPEPTLTSLLEEQSRRTPGAVAVRFGGRQLDYAELHRRADRLALRLRGLGVGPDVVVGVRLERSLELMIGLLAVLKAGGGYLPLDPGYPAERLEFMLADSGAAVLLTGPGSSGVVAEGVTVLTLGRGDAEDGTGDGTPYDAPVEAPADAPYPVAGPDHLAYTIYTSGSTGRPKGVQVPHRGIVNRLRWMQSAYHLDADDTVLQKTPISFDVSVWELFWPLLTGAVLVLADPGGHRDPGYLAELVQREKVTVCHFVPPMLGSFLDAPEAARCGSLRLVVCSGEALPAELAQRFHRTLPAALENLYGPTEASVDVTRWSSRPDWSRPGLPIGTPIANTRVYVLDGLMSPAPIGVPGELYLGGVQLARGYGGRPALTADRFVPDPFAGDGSRLYRTGDLARWLPEGVVEYLGRTDDQVKVRGFRIELGEIEAALTALPGVGQAVVVVRADGPGDRRIVAYLTPGSTGTAGPTGRELRAGLGRVLPEHMVPSAFVLLDALPLSPNGKVDRGALPAPGHARAEATEYRAPGTPAERQLAELWQQVLLIDRIGVRDNFFELGGDSMHAVRISGLARERGLDLPLTELFAHPTIEAVAAGLATRTGPSAGPGPTPPADRPGVAAFALLSPEDLARLRSG
ncbi:amino acid adenylation domain-containing protein [Streptomyces sp. NBC_00683]|uniref:non-ribosomal peptide synthetase n=1 Tax=Streptomyces sp. NBC_00683 TaxID=2903670 RepID=UPI002E3766E6|nr:non-ribosomal peptide synthetase [Streptomyces sp. NBC_00683]